jgi:glucose/arabinose dehydrogenase
MWQGSSTSGSWLGVVATAAMWLSVPSLAHATTLPSGFGEQAIVTGLQAPTTVDWAPDGRMFVAEKAGRVRIVASDGTLLPEPLLDIRDQVNDHDDRGLVGLAVDSDFSTNGYLYLAYARELDPLNPDSGAEMASRVTRVSVKPDSTLENAGDPETVILGTQSDQPCPPPDNAVDCIPAFHFHAVGTVRSDPTDGTLWVSSGDSHDNNVVDELAYLPQDETSYAGKILHVDRDGHGLPGHPFCPADDDLTHVCTKVYAKGFRNPFRFTLRPGKGPVVGDVGNRGWEEVDLIEAGENNGWPCYEGPVRYALFESEAGCQPEYAKEGTPDEAAAPAWSYDHSAGCSAVIGGPVYDGDAYPASFAGKLFVGDWCQGWIKVLTLSATDEVTQVEDFAADWSGVDLELTPDGDLAYVDWAGGAVRRVKSPPDTSIDSGPPAGSATADDTPTFAFSSTEPNSSFECRVDGGGFSGCSTPHTTDQLHDGDHSVEVRATGQAQNTDQSPAGRSFSVDTTPPHANLFAKRGRKAGRRIRIDVTCDEDCTATAKGKLTVPKRTPRQPTVSNAAVARKSFRLRKASAALAGGKTATLKLIPAGRRAGRRIARRVERGSKGKAEIVVTTADPVGNASVKRLIIRLNGPTLILARS